MKKYGIKYLKLSVKVIFEFIEVIEPQQGNFLQKWIKRIKIALGLIPDIQEVIKNGGEVWNEFKDLDEIEKKELIKYAASLGVEGDILAKIEASFDFVLSGYKLYEVWKK